MVAGVSIACMRIAPLRNSVLPGITRDSIVQIARDLNIPVVEQMIPREMLYLADEVFFTGTAAEVTPIRSIDKIKVSNLDECRAPPRSRDDVPRADWSGDGNYLLPLRALPGEAGHYEVVPIPPSPGFEMHNVVRIYPATSESIAQYQRIKPKS